MPKIKIKVSNTGSKRTQYHYKSSVGPLSVNDMKEISIDVGDTLYFENDNGIKYLIKSEDQGKTFYYTK